MTKYDFTTLPNRLTHHTYKWKETETDPEIIPAWIADMDFNVIPEVREAVIGYADQMVYGSEWGVIGGLSGQVGIKICHAISSL